MVDIRRKPWYKVSIFRSSSPKVKNNKDKNIIEIKCSGRSQRQFFVLLLLESKIYIKDEN